MENASSRKIGNIDRSFTRPGPSREMRQAMKLGFSTGTSKDLVGNYSAAMKLILGIDGEKLKIVVQYFIDESIAFYSLDELLTV